MSSIADIDPEVLGRQLLAVPLAADVLGHRNPIETVRTYIHPGSVEGRFLCDLLTGASTDELLDRWYGGAEGSRALKASLAARRGADLLELVVEKEA